MTYDEAVQYLTSSYNQKRMRHEFDVLRKMYALVGSPQDRLKVIHVAGTNGKGSSCAMLTAILQCAGYRVGMFVSPHLTTYNERISINGEWISDQDFARLIGVVKQLSDDVLGEEMLLYFEILTMVCFLYFAEQSLDYVVVETGLGGRLDCTNIIEKPILSVITSIGLDHTAILGDTIEQIALEKAGILKKNCPAVLYFGQRTVYNICHSVSHEKQCSLYYLGDTVKIDVAYSDLYSSVFSFRSSLFSLDDVSIGLLGDYQIYNAINVLYCVTILRSLGVTVSEQAVRKGLATVKWPGRMELLAEKPIVLLDGAHNIDAILMFDKSLRKWFGSRKKIVVLGVLEDKQADEILRVIVDLADVVIVTAPNTVRALDPTIFCRLVDRDNKSIIMERDYQNAFRLALDLAQDDDVVAVTGSLYLVGDIRYDWCRRR